MVIATLKIDCESSEAGYLKGWMSDLTSSIDDLLNCGLDVINQPIGTYHRIFITAQRRTDANQTAIIESGESSIAKSFFSGTELSSYRFSVGGTYRIDIIRYDLQVLNLQNCIPPIPG